MKSLFFIAVFILGILSHVRAGEDENGLNSLSATAIKYVASESAGDWDQCYSMLSSLITHKLNPKGFRSWMTNSPVNKKFTKPVRSNVSSLKHQKVELGRVVIRDAEAPADDLTRIASLTLIKENDVWRVMSVSGLKSHSIIDEVFYCEMIAREIQADKSE